MPINATSLTTEQVAKIVSSQCRSVVQVLQLPSENLPAEPSHLLAISAQAAASIITCIDKQTPWTAIANEQFTSFRVSFFFGSTSSATSPTTPSLADYLFEQSSRDPAHISPLRHVSIPASVHIITHGENASKCTVLQPTNVSEDSAGNVSSHRHAILRSTQVVHPHCFPHAQMPKASLIIGRIANEVSLITIHDHEQFLASLGLRDYEAQSLWAASTTPSDPTELLDNNEPLIIQWRSPMPIALISYLPQKISLKWRDAKQQAAQLFVHWFGASIIIISPPRFAQGSVSGTQQVSLYTTNLDSRKKIICGVPQTNDSASGSAGSAVRIGTHSLVFEQLVQPANEFKSEPSYVVTPPPAEPSTEPPDIPNPERDVYCACSHFNEELLLQHIGEALRTTDITINFILQLQAPTRENKPQYIAQLIDPFLSSIGIPHSAIYSNIQEAFTIAKVTTLNSFLDLKPSHITAPTGPLAHAIIQLYRQLGNVQCESAVIVGLILLYGSALGDSAMREQIQLNKDWQHVYQDEELLFHIPHFIAIALLSLCIPDTGKSRFVKELCASIWPSAEQSQKKICTKHTTSHGVEGSIDNLYTVDEMLQISSSFIHGILFVANHVCQNQANAASVDNKATPMQVEASDNNSPQVNEDEAGDDDSKNGNRTATTLAPPSAMPMRRKLILFSLFDGLGVARVAVEQYLKAAGLLPTLRGAVAAEIDRTAVEIMMAKWGPTNPAAPRPRPLIVYDVWHLVHNQLLPLANILSQIPLGAVLAIIAGSPCQDFTFAGQFQGRLGMCGSRSILIFVPALLCYACQQLRPDITIVFLGENAGSMRLEFVNAIKEILLIPTSHDSEYFSLIDTMAFSPFKRARYFFSHLPYAKDNQWVSKHTSSSPFEPGWKPASLPLPVMMRARPTSPGDGLNNGALRSLYQYRPQHLLYDTAKHPTQAPEWDKILPEQLRPLLQVLADTPCNKDRLQWEAKVRPLCIWLETNGRQHGVRTPTGTERLAAMQLQDYASICPTEKDKINLTGNTFHPQAICARLEGNGETSLANILTGPPDLFTAPAFLNPETLLEAYARLRATVCEDLELAPHCVKLPFSSDFLWTPAIIANAKRAAQPGNSGHRVDPDEGLTHGDPLHPTAALTVSCGNPSMVHLTGHTTWKQKYRAWSSRKPRLVVKLSNVSSSPRDLEQAVLNEYEPAPRSFPPHIIERSASGITAALRQVYAMAIMQGTLPEEHEECLIASSQPPGITGAHHPFSDVVDIWREVVASYETPLNLWMTQAILSANNTLSICDVYAERIVEVQRQAPWVLIAVDGSEFSEGSLIIVTQGELSKITLSPEVIPVASLVATSSKHDAIIQVRPAIKHATSLGLLPLCASREIEIAGSLIELHSVLKDALAELLQRWKQQDNHSADILPADCTIGIQYHRQIPFSSCESIAHQCPNGEWPRFIYLLFAEPARGAKKPTTTASVTGAQPYPVTAICVHAQWFVSLKGGDISQRCASLRNQVVWTSMPAAHREIFANYVAGAGTAAHPTESTDDILIDDA